MSDAIGGYFGLELRKGEHYHKDALRLNSARNCFEYVLLARQYKRVYVPYFTCEVMLEPLHKLGIEYTFYHINEQHLFSAICHISQNRRLHFWRRLRYDPPHSAGNGGEPQVGHRG